MDPNRSKPRIPKLTKLPLVDFLINLLPYLLRRSSQFYVFAISTLEVAVISFNKLKNSLVRRMFWGRGSLYKSSFHIVITVFTSLLLITGILGRVGLVTEASEQALSISYGTLGNNDLLAQGASLTTVLPLDDDTHYNFAVSSYRVRSGDTLSEIAEKFGVSKDTIKWANDSKLSPYNDDIKVGDTLLIPEIDGVLYKVEKGDTLDSVVKLTSGNRFDIIELNNLVPPKYSLKVGSRLFIPGGEIEAPPEPEPEPVYVYVPPVVSSTGAGQALAGISFTDPLASCGSYIWMRGYSLWHSGVDLASLGAVACTVSAAASGTVISAGWAGAAGFQIAIDHGNGVTTHYWHASALWVNVGQKVSRGQAIMAMGSTGNSTGVHLHLELRHNNITMDPSPYIPYLR